MPDDSANPPLEAFLEQYRKDHEKGAVRSVREYMDLFHGDDTGIAREYLRLEATEASSANESSRFDEEQLGPYRIVEELGRGGQGVVYLAEDTRLGRKVALKILRGLGPGAEEVLLRFKREAAVASRLDDPGICAVYDTGIENGVPYIAMRYIEGESLAHKVSTLHDVHTPATSICIDLEAEEVGGNDLDTEYEDDTSTAPSTRDEIMRVVKFFEQVARSLHVAHEAGVVHRDIKPGNIMVTSRGQGVIMDFGLARAEDENLPTLTRSGDLFGTPAYMSPEQLTRQSVRLDARTDVWSLGVALYECLTLKRPFDAPTREGLYQAILSKDPPDPAKLSPGVPSDLKIICETALEKDRDRRYQTAEALAEDLRRVSTFEPIQASPITRWIRLRRWAQRNPALATSLVALFLVLIAGLAVSLIFLREARHQEHIATEALDDADAKWRRAVRSEDAAQDVLAQSLFQQARLMRLKNEMGRRLEALGLLKRTMNLITRERTPLQSELNAERPDNLPTPAKLRREAVTLLNLWDARRVPAGPVQELPPSRRPPWKGALSRHGHDHAAPAWHVATPTVAASMFLGSKTTNPDSLAPASHLRVHDKLTGRWLKEFEITSLAETPILAVDPANERVATWDRQLETARIWNLNDLSVSTPLPPPPRSSKNEGVRLAFDPAARYLVCGLFPSGYTEGEVLVWDLQSPEAPLTLGRVPTFSLREHPLVFDKSGQRLACFGLAVTVWEFPGGHRLGHRPCKGGLRNRPVWTEDDRLLLALPHDGESDRLVTWHPETGRVQGPVATSVVSRSCPPAVSADGRLVACVSDDAVNILSLSDGSYVLAWPRQGATPQWALWSEDGTRLHVGGNGGYECYEQVRGAAVRTSISLQRPDGRRNSPDDRIGLLSFGPQGRHLAAREVLNGVALWVVDTRDWSVRHAREVGIGNPECVRSSVTFDHTGRRLAVAKPYSVELWDLETGKRLVTQTPGKNVVDVAWEPDGQALVILRCSGSDRGEDHLEVRALAASEPLLEIPAAVADSAWLSRDGRFVVHSSSQTVPELEIITSWTPVVTQHDILNGRQRRLVDFDALETDAWFQGITARGDVLISLHGTFRTVVDEQGQHRIGKGTAALWSVFDGTKLDEITLCDRERLAAVSPDGDLTVIQHDRHSGFVSSHRLSPPAERAWLYSRASRTRLLELPGSPIAFAFSPDGRHLATSNGDSIVVWHMDELKRALTEHGLGW